MPETSRYKQISKHARSRPVALASPKHAAHPDARKMVCRSLPETRRATWPETSKSLILPEREGASCPGPAAPEFAEGQLTFQTSNASSSGLATRQLSRTNSALSVPDKQRTSFPETYRALSCSRRRISRSSSGVDPAPACVGTHRGSLPCLAYTGPSSRGRRSGGA